MKKRAYLVGIKGVAMTALAVYLKESGWEVAGSDVMEFFLPTKFSLPGESRLKQVSAGKISQPNMIW